MDFKKEFLRIMNEQNQIALATDAKGIPNVRIVNFCCRENHENIVYFSTFGDNQKVAEFKQNPTVAFTTIPQNSYAHVRVTDANIIPSKKTIYDLQDEFIKKIEGYDDIIDSAGKFLVLYEIHVTKADVVLDHTSCETITL